MPKLDFLKKELVRYAHKAADDGLVFSRSGNLSARSRGKFYIKASGVSFSECVPNDFVGLDIDKPDLLKAKKKPSCEHLFHKACYGARPDIKVVFHTHPLISTVLYSSGVTFGRALTLEFALYVGLKKVGKIPFSAPGTKKLASDIAKKIRDYDALILKNHGLLTVGPTFQDAYLKALVIEREARAQYMCRLFKVNPSYLSQSQIHSIANV
ncbi:MAG: class II aldolase/adducin family protein [Candidatus Omnitrophota bacterium]